ncbi:MAG: succinate dehydrogenase cytochrome b560 subunit [Benjaminiella poitrasii]|nr:MAG: succinate dehydrogenase cytochrome b560 subunit [Benjaminiella poitrasii]
MSSSRPLVHLLLVQQKSALSRSLINRNAASLGIRQFQVTRQCSEQSPSAESDILRAQRKLRPNSPHLAIYQPQLTWYMSSAHRLTGVAIGGALYLSSMAYLAAPAFGLHIDSDTIITHFAAAPDAVKYAAKAVLAAPFTYHVSNGLRHLVWDSGRCLDMKGVYRTGYAVLASTVIGTLYLASL